MKSDAKRQAEYQARQVSKGKARLSCWIDSGTKQAFDELSEQHGKTIAEVIELGIAAASSLLAGRLQITMSAAQPAPRVALRTEPQERRQLHEHRPSDINTLPPANCEFVAPPRKPKPTMDDVDARIRAAAFTVGP